VIQHKIGQQTFQNHQTMSALQDFQINSKSSQTNVNYQKNHSLNFQQKNSGKIREFFKNRIQCKKVSLSEFI
jgi:hypothetical protein